MGSIPHLVENCFGLIQLFSDGSVLRSDGIKFSFPVVEDNSVLFRDCLFDETSGLYLRLYKPQFVSPGTKLPVLVFLHGGGFCFGARDWPHINNCATRLSSSLKALVIAPDYRLAPEHRLPAPIDDALTALRWIQCHAGDDSFIDDAADLGRVFVVGDSSGGNIAHHLAVRLGPGSKGLEPLRIRGYILLAPFFGGDIRTTSEEEASEEELSLEILDTFWRLSMPIGATRDHPLVNPFGSESLNLQHVSLDPILVIVGSDELLRDRCYDYASKLKDMGKNVDYSEFKGKQHGFFVSYPYSDDVKGVLDLIHKFMIANS